MRNIVHASFAIARVIGAGLTLPGHLRAQAASRAADYADGAIPLHILICDDDAATRFVLKRFLKRHYPCDITECDNGKTALSLLAGRKIDLVLLDLNMPVMDGLSTLERIRATAETATVPVMILTEDRSEPVVRRAVALGVSGFTGKPLNADKLRAKFDDLIYTAIAGGA